MSADFSFVVDTIYTYSEMANKYNIYIQNIEEPLGGKQNQKKTEHSYLLGWEVCN